MPTFLIFARFVLDMTHQETITNLWNFVIDLYARQAIIVNEPPEVQATFNVFVDALKQEQTQRLRAKKAIEKINPGFKLPDIYFSDFYYWCGLRRLE